MITKGYYIMCEGCTKSEALLGRTKKECEDEARRMGYAMRKGDWYCSDCLEEKKGK